MEENNTQPRNFEEDLNNSNNPTLRKSWEKIFKLKFGNECIISWRDEISIQKGLGTDVTITTREGRRYSIELKTRNESCYKKEWIMEIKSHVYDKEDKETRNHLYSKDGWIYCCTAEYLFHGTLNEDGTDFTEVIFYSLSPFKNEGYKSEYDKYENLWLPTLYPDGKFQLTLNKLIPKDVIKEDSSEFWEWTKDGN